MLFTVSKGLLWETEALPIWSLSNQATIKSKALYSEATSSVNTKMQTTQTLL